MKYKYIVQFYSSSTYSEYRYFTCKAKALKVMRKFIKHKKVLHSKDKGFIKTVTPFHDKLRPCYIFECIRNTNYYN